MAIVGLILSILGIVGIGGFFVPFMGFATFLCSLLGLIFGAVAMKKGKHHGVAVAALVIGIIGLVLNVPAAICGICTAGCAAAGGAASCLEDAASSVAGLLVF